LNPSFWLPLLLVSVLLACTDTSTSDITIHNTSSRPWHDVRLFSGDDKFSWAVLEPGADVDITLRPLMNSPPQVTLIYHGQVGPDGVGADKHVWEGPPVPAGQSIQLKLDIAGPDHVRAKQCTMPCELT
jgi:hypothetical protein